MATDTELATQILDSIRSRASRYVLSDSLESAWAFGSVGLGETTVRHLEDQHADVLRRLLSNGSCVLGSHVDFVSTEMYASIDPDTGFKYHKDLRVRGRIVEPAIA